ncbi:hypothetical protein CapIbe_010252 [Capra ibex]
MGPDEWYGSVVWMLGTDEAMCYHGIEKAPRCSQCAALSSNTLLEESVHLEEKLLSHGSICFYQEHRSSINRRENVTLLGVIPESPAFTWFPTVRGDGVMRGLEATESDSFAVTPVWLDWDEGGDGTLETGGCLYINDPKWLPKSMIQMPAPIPHCHFQLPSKPDLFLNESATH